jgi:hypothetical protein
LSFSKQKRVLEFKEIEKQRQDVARAVHEDRCGEEKAGHVTIIKWISQVRKSGEKRGVVASLIAARLVQEFDDERTVKEAENLLHIYEEAGNVANPSQPPVPNPLAESLRRQLLDFSHQVERLASFAESKLGTREELESQVDSLPWMGGEATKLAVRWIMDYFSDAG